MLSWPLVFILVATLVFRTYNLNYNVPFSDEAIYVVVGQFGLFERDWYTFNANSWMGGSQFLYPVMTALSYQIGGIVGSRFFNVLLGVLIVEITYLAAVHLYKGTIPEKRFAGWVSAAIVGGSVIGFYVSRLATYDLPSFYFLFLSMLILLLTDKYPQKAGRLYFFAALILVVAFLTKLIVAIYVPFIMLISFAHAVIKKDQLFKLWVLYFAIPIVLFFSTYALISLTNIQTFSSNQISGKDRATYLDVIQMYLYHTWGYWILWAIASLGMLFTKKKLLWIILTILSLNIFLVHIVGKRILTFDKHIFLSIPFLAMVIGIGFTSIIYSIQIKHIRAFAKGMILGIVILFWLISAQFIINYNNKWPNVAQGLEYLRQNTKPGERILTEVGPAVTLTLYEKNYPMNVSTFDFLSYDSESGAEAFKQAINDGFFDVIQLYESDDKEILFAQIHQVVEESMKDKYSLVYENNGFKVYRRNT